MFENERRLDRERVLTLLYEIEMKGDSAAVVIASLPTELEEFVSETVLGVSNHVGELDETIDHHSHGWDVDRMATVDRNILRIGVWELAHRKDLSVAIVVNEALELARIYSTEESRKFINGVLSAVAGDQDRSASSKNQLPG